MIYDKSGHRKYLTARERRAFILAARDEKSCVETFCLTLAYTGARLSEVLALTQSSIDIETNAIVIECLKKRKRGVYRAIPVPEVLTAQLIEVHNLRLDSQNIDQNRQRLWPWSRTTAWAKVRLIMVRAGIHPRRAMPKALRHAFGVVGIQAHVPLNVLQKWMGHARLTTTAIYADATGEEERSLAKSMWLLEDFQR